MLVPERLGGPAYLIVATNANGTRRRVPQRQQQHLRPADHHQPRAPGRPGHRRRAAAGPGVRRHHHRGDLPRQQPRRWPPPTSRLDRHHLADPRPDAAQPDQGRRAAGHRCRTPASWATTRRSSARRPATRDHDGDAAPAHLRAVLHHAPGPTRSTWCSRARWTSTSTPTTPTS